MRGARDGAGGIARAPELYSHSRLSSFERCPKQFHYRYVLKLPTEAESIESFVGKRVHEVIERLHRFVSRGQVPTLAQVLKRFGRLFREHYDPARIRIVRSDRGDEHYRASGERCLSNFYRRQYPFDADETLGLEERVTFALDERGAYRMQGIVDRLVQTREGAIEIHDYKTGRRLPSQEDLDGDRQLALYELGVRRRYGSERPVRLVWHFLWHDAVRSSTRTPGELEGLRDRTVALIDRIRAERDFEARTGPLCRWCEYADRCPAQTGRPEPAAEPAKASAAPGVAGSQLPLL